MGFPFPVGLKNDVLMLWSSRIMVIDLANIGSERISIVIVINIDQDRRFIWIIFVLWLLLFLMVVIMLMDLSRDDIPFMWRDRIVKLIEILLLVDSGGYKVHPVLILLLISILVMRVRVDILRSHILRLLVRGKDMSFIGFIMGIIQLVSLLIMIGIVMKKIMNRAWVVIVELNRELLLRNLFVCIISIRRMILREVPSILDQMPMIR